MKGRKKGATDHPKDRVRSSVGASPLFSDDPTPLTNDGDPGYLAHSRFPTRDENASYFDLEFTNIAD